MKRVLFITVYVGLVALYGVFNQLTVVHVGALVLWLALFLTQKTSKQAIAILPAMGAILAYDFLRVFAPSSLGRLATEPVIAIETALFGTESGRLPPELLVDIYHPILDFISGPVYGNHVTGFAIVGIYLLVRFPNATRVDQFFWGFLALNLAANTIQLLFPVAAPWYVDLHGLVAPTVLPDSNPAGLIRFDELVGVTYFQDLYGKASYPFGAMPSLHVAFPTWAALFCQRVWTRTAAIGFALLTCFFAVYTNHHYLIDVVAGLALAVAIRFVVERPAAIRFFAFVRGKLSTIVAPLESNARV